MFEKFGRVRETTAEGKKSPLQDIVVAAFVGHGSSYATLVAAYNLREQGARVHILDFSSSDSCAARELSSCSSVALMYGMDQHIIDGNSLEDIMQIVSISDVVVGTSLPTIISAVELHEQNPALICLWLPDFAANDKENQHNYGWNAIVSSVGGVFSDMGINRSLAGKKVSYSPLPQASVYAAALGLTSIVFALLARQRHGCGDNIIVPLSSALHDALAHNSIEFDVPSRYEIPRRAALRALNANRSTNQSALDYRDIQDLLDPFFATYKCSDGRPYYLVAASHFKHQQRCLEALELGDAARALGLVDSSTTREGSDETWVRKKRYAGSGEPSYHGLAANPFDPTTWAVLRPLMRQAFRSRSALAWERVMDDARVPGAAHRTTDEWVHSDHAIESGLIIDTLQSSSIEDASTSQPPSSPRRPGPLAWVRTFTLPEKESPVVAPNDPVVEPRDEDETHSSAAAWAEGLKILDACNVIAGPTVASVLARFGAEVIKLDAAEPSYSPDVTIIYGLACNSGKKSSALINVCTDEGRRALNELIRWADVITINAPTSTLQHLGLSPRQILSVTTGRKPPVLLHFDAWSGPRGSVEEPAGLRANALGYDDCLQACLGIMERFGGSLETPEEHAHVGTIDVVAGFAGAFACGLALFEADNRRLARCPSSGLQQELIVAKTSLAASGNFLVFPFVGPESEENNASAEGKKSHHSGNQQRQSARGPNALGEHALHRIYECSDGRYIFLAATGPLNPDRGVKFLALDALARATLDRNLVRVSLKNFDILDDTLAFTLTRIFKSMNAEYWVTLLPKSSSFSSVELPCVPLNNIADLRARNTRVVTAKHRTTELLHPLDHGSFGFERVVDHPLGTPVTLFDTRLSIRPQNAILQPLCPAPKYGSTTIEILRSVCKLSDDDITAMIESGSASIKWSDEYLPGGVWELDDKNQTSRSDLSSQETCSICLCKTNLDQWMTLLCGHGYCRKCLRTAAKQGHAQCPICRRPHELDSIRLVQQTSRFKKGYSNWRRGKTEGAQGANMAAAVTKPHGYDSTNRSYYMKITTDKTAGDLHIANYIHNSTNQKDPFMCSLLSTKGKRKGKEQVEEEEEEECRVLSPLSC